MIEFRSSALSHKILFTTASILVVFSACTVDSTNVSEPPSLASIDSESDRDGEETAWHKILKITEESPRLETKLGGPTAVELPAAEVATQIRWATEGRVVVYVYADGWKLQKPHGEFKYTGTAWVAFLSGPALGGVAFIGWGTANFRCGDNIDLLDGGDTAWTGPRFLTRPPAKKAAEGLVSGRAKVDAGGAVRSYDGCPTACPTPVAGGNVTHSIPDSGSSWSFLASIGGPDMYYGWADYKWNVYVKCQ